MAGKKIFLFHHAGGDKYAYRMLQQEFSPYYETIAVELPGRGDRFSEPLLHDIHAATEDLFVQIRSMLSDVYAFVGVSMGALKAFLLAHRIFEEGLPLPKHLFLASRKSLLGYSNHSAIAGLPSVDFWNGVAQYGGVSASMMAHPELLALYEPILRADFHALENYSSANYPPLPIKASILIGDQDAITTADIAPWQESFIPIIDIQVFNGGHFFIYEQIKDVSDYIRNRY